MHAYIHTYIYMLMCVDIHIHDMYISCVCVCVGVCVGVCFFRSVLYLFAHRKDAFCLQTYAHGTRQDCTATTKPRKDVCSTK